MNKLENLEKIFMKHGYNDYKWIKSKDIVVAQWVRIKCTYGCKSYGVNGACPPNVPSVTECREFFKEYQDTAIFHFEKTLDSPEERFAWGKEINRNLLKLEREVFLSGFQKAFLFYMDECCVCDDCSASRVDCKNQKAARPCPEAFAVDIFSTVEKCGYPINVLAEYSEKMNRYAFLMVE